MNVKVYGLVEGLMVQWDEVKDAAQYHVHLFIGDWNRHMEFVNGRQTMVDAKKITFKELALISVDRNIKFYSFKGLARIHAEYTYEHGYRCKHDTGRSYYVMVEAEDRNGNMIDTSEKVSGISLEMDNGYASEG